MINIITGKMIFDNIIRDYRIDTDEILKKNALFIGNTRFGEDIVEIVCPKRKQITEEQWDAMNYHDSKDKKIAQINNEPRFLYLARASDIEISDQNNRDSLELMSLFKQKREKYQLDMKIMNLHYILNRDKLICVYTANQRVDFREFVKDIGSQLKQRIEMFQIDIRDAVKLEEICGACGRLLCCSIGCTAFINDKKYNTRTAKMLGVCGKIRCCSLFEESP